MPASKSSDKSDPKTRKIIDVSEPGKTAPPETSRPIIVSSRPILRRDPMMASPDGIEKEEPQEEKPVIRTGKPILKISPLTPDEKPEEATQPTTAQSAPTAPAAPTKPSPMSVQPLTDATKVAMPGTVTEGDIIEDDEAPAKPDSGPAAEPEFMLEKPDTPAPKVSEAKPASTPEPKTAEPAPASSPTPVPTPAPPSEPEVPEEPDDDEDTDGQLAPNQAVDVAKRREEDAKAAQLAEQEKIIESKQYFLPISAVEKRRGLERFVLLLLVVILLALVWLDIALDAGIIKVGGVHALTHFFK